MRRGRTLLAGGCAAAALITVAVPATADRHMAGSPSAPRTVNVRLVQIANLDGSPTAAAMHKGDNRLYVTLQEGRVVAVSPNGTQKLVLDITNRTHADGERGLLGIAFAPDAKHVYVDYTDNDGNINVDEYAVRHDGSFNKATRRRVLFQDHSAHSNHNGGNLVFGPDGYLYIGIGDGGGSGDPFRSGQRLNTLLGKILRIDPRRHGRYAHGIPKGNPFVTVPGARKEIWSYGLRNPWKFSFDRATHNLWIADVGQDDVEEVDHVSTGRGLNFGWSAYEGTHRYNDDQSAPGATMPVYEYLHSGKPGGCAIIGGFVYRGHAIPALVGTYLFADLCTDGVRALDTANPGAGEHYLTSSPSSIVGFAQGPAGEIYVLSNDGPVFRLAPA